MRKNMTTVGLLEDEQDLCSEIAEYIERQHFKVLQCANVAEFNAIKSHIHIAIIDVNLPDGNGFDVTKDLHISHPDVGIIMLTAKGEITDKIEGLNRGADQYLVKPIKFSELSAHIQALDRRLSPPVWQLNITSQQLTSPQHITETLTTYELIFLQLLAKKMGEIIPRNEIAEAFGINWVDYDERHLDQLVSRLRKRWKLLHNVLPVKTAHRHGYSFCEPIRIMNPSAEAEKS